jgi:hypothetical protein
MSWYYDTISGPDLAFDRRALRSDADVPRLPGQDIRAAAVTDRLGSLTRRR